MLTLVACTVLENGTFKPKKSRRRVNKLHPFNRFGIQKTRYSACLLNFISGNAFNFISKTVFGITRHKIKLKRCSVDYL